MNESVEGEGARNQEALKELYEREGIPFEACYGLGGPWQKYPDEFLDIPNYYVIAHRLILPHEVVFDLDCDKQDVEVHAVMLRKRLHDGSIAYAEWDTGGRGKHFHTFFPELLGYDDGARKFLKEAILKHFTLGFMKEAGIDLQLAGKHLIRSEWAYHEKSGKQKVLVGEGRTDEYPYSRLPKAVLYYFEHEYEPPKTEWVQGYRQGYDDFPSIKYLLTTKLRDGKKRALKVMCNHFHIKYGESGLDHVQSWNQEVQHGAFSARRVELEWNAIKKMHGEGKHFGRTYVSRLMAELGRSDLMEEQNEEQKSKDGATSDRKNTLTPRRTPK